MKLMKLIYKSYTYIKPADSIDSVTHAVYLIIYLFI